MKPPKATAEELAQGKSPETSADEQEFHDAMDANDEIRNPAAYVQEELQREMAQVEQLDVLEGLRALQTGDPILWKIYRVGSTDPDQNGFLDTWSTSQLTQDRIRDEFGGGTYRIRGTFSNGRYAGGRTIRIAGDAKRRDKIVAQGVGNGAFNLSEFLSQQEARDAQRRQAESDRREEERRQRKEEEDKREQRWERTLALAIPAVTSLATAMVGAFANRGSQMADIAALMTAMKGPDPMTVLTQLKALEKSNDTGLMAKLLPNLLDLATSRASTGDSGWIDVVKELAKSAGPAVGTLVQGAIEQANQARLAQTGTSSPVMYPTLPNPIPEEVPARSARSAPLIVVPESRRPRDRPVTSVNNPSNVGSADVSHLESTPTSVTAGTAGPSSRSVTPARGADMDLTLLPFLPLLRHQGWLVGKLQQLGWAAQRQKDAELYAALFLEELPEGVEARMVAQLLARADWYQLLCQLEPRLQRDDFLPWFDQLRAHLLRSIEEETGVAQGIQHAAGQTSSGVQKVEVRGPAPSGGNSAPDSSSGTTPAPVPSPKAEISRPTQIPDLYGRIEE